jgi:hypothetical protein
LATRLYVRYSELKTTYTETSLTFFNVPIPPVKSTGLLLGNNNGTFYMCMILYGATGANSFNLREILNTHATSKPTLSASLVGGKYQVVISSIVYYGAWQLILF